MGSGSFARKAMQLGLPIQSIKTFSIHQKYLFSTANKPTASGVKNEGNSGS